MGFPNLPGIPPLAGGLAGAVTVAAPLINNLLDKLKPAWGIYDMSGKKLALKPDSFLSIMLHNEYNLPTFPLEQGAFDTYNKVATPYDITVRVAKSNTIGFPGTNPDKMKDFLKVLDKLVVDTELYSIVTPDATYLNANMKGFDYKREINNGAAIIIADLHFVEILPAVIRKSATASTQVAPAASATTPSAHKPTNSGAVSASHSSARSTGAH